MKQEPCHACGALGPKMDGPVHRYLESSPGCWAMYGEVLAREFSDVAYFANHRFTVDAYAVQHPGQPSPQSIQSVALHLASLFVILERDTQPKAATELMQGLAQHKAAFHWIEPPADLGARTVRDLWETHGLEAHLNAARDWAEAAWSAWEPHHDQVRDWVERLG
ncbi:MAG: DUF5946 family protein [Acidobacteriota bacterium]